MANALVPDWLVRLESSGLRPYIATSRKLLSSINTVPFGCTPQIYLLDEPADRPFLEAYLVANSLSFSVPTFKMPHWILIDCVLMQTAIVGFSLPLTLAPSVLIDKFKSDPKLEMHALAELPISGQISALNADGESLTGFSLFSLAKHLDNLNKVSLYTKVLALEVYKARPGDIYYGVTQYDNPSLRVHGRFTKELELYQPLVPLHPGADNTLIYRMVLDYDPFNLLERIPKSPPTFWLNSNDAKKKRAIAKGIARGSKYLIDPPYFTSVNGEVRLPIVEIT